MFFLFINFQFFFYFNFTIFLSRLPDVKYLAYKESYDIHHLSIHKKIKSDPDYIAERILHFICFIAEFFFSFFYFSYIDATVVKNCLCLAV